MSETAIIESRIDRSTAGAIDLRTTGGMQVTDVGQAMEVAKLMSISGSAVPAHIRNNPGTCLAVAIQAWEWSMNPFAVANKSYVVNDRLAYESALYNAVVTRRAPIVGRLRSSYVGEGPTRRCTITATLRDDAGGGEVDYRSPEFKDINPKNSPLWKNDPDQQLFYFSCRAFVRRHFPDVMMGVYTVDEIQDAPDAPPAKKVRDTGSIDVSAVLGKTTEKTTVPGGTAATAPQPKAKEAKEKATEKPAEDAPPEPTQKTPTAPAPDAAKKESAAADPAAEVLGRIKAAWAREMRKRHNWDEDAPAELVDEQLEEFCLNHWAKRSLEDVVANKPAWLDKLLGYLNDTPCKIPAERFDFHVAEAPKQDAAPVEQESVIEEPAKPNRPGRK